MSARRYTPMADVQRVHQLQQSLAMALRQHDRQGARMARQGIIAVVWRQWTTAFPAPPSPQIAHCPAAARRR